MTFCHSKGSRFSMGIPIASACPTLGQRASRRTVSVRADLSAKGKAHRAANISVEKLMGEGSFGQVFNGSLSYDEGDEERVVLKRVKSRVQGAEAMGEMEHLLNVYAARAAKGHCADFVGYCEVSDDEATARLTPGLWLIWRYEGSKTLGYYHRRRDTLEALARDLEVPREAVVAVTMKHILEGLAAFHAAGLVHRDVKPLNIILAEDEKRLKLIDLGACADLRSGTNYVPDETILDPLYCPPEQYILPTDSAKLSKNPLRLAISPMMWAQHHPDRFDTWSAGIVMLQTALPSMRTERALRQFKEDFGRRYDYDISAWRRGSYMNRNDTALLDADNGAGWDLLQNLLRPREMITDDNGKVSFRQKPDTPARYTAQEALRHSFIKQARLEGAAASRTAGSSFTGGRPAGSSFTGGRRPGTSESRPSTATGASTTVSGAVSSSTGGGGGFGGLWRSMTNRLFDLEAKIKTQASMTEVQTISVKKLQQEVTAGRADPAALQVEETRLQQMATRLNSLQQDFTSTASVATNIFSALGLWGQKKTNSPANTPAAASATSSTKPAGSALRGVGGGTGPTAGKKAAPEAKVSAASTSASVGTGSSRGLSIPGAAADFAGGLSDMWHRLTLQLGDLDSKLSNQASATRKQQAVVQDIRKKQATSPSSADVAQQLSREERRLSLMEQRLVDLDLDFREAQKQANQVFAALFGGGGTSAEAQGSSSGVSTPASSSRGTPAGKTASTPTPSKQQPQPKEKAAAPAKESGWASWWGSAFGMSGTADSNVAQSAPVSASNQSKKVTAAPAPSAAPKATVSGTSGSTSGSTATSGGSKLTEGAASLVASSWKFTGVAARLAAGMAASLQEDAGKRFREFEVDQEAKRLVRAQEAQLKALLQEREVPLAAAGDFDVLAPSLATDMRWLAVADNARRRAVWNEYMEGLQRKEKQGRLLLETNLRTLFRSIMTSPDDDWETVSVSLAREAPFQALASDPAAQRRLFGEVVAELKLAAALRQAAARAEREFEQLLQEALGPTVLQTGTSWGLVKPMVWKDPRYAAVPEKRRREMFESAIKVAKAQAVDEAEAAAVRALVEAEARAAAEARVATAAAQAAAEAEGAAAAQAAAAKVVAETQAARAASNISSQGMASALEGPGGGSAVSQSDLMDQLRQEQARLKAEYERMEAMLRSMESSMAQEVVAQKAGDIGAHRNGVANSAVAADVGDGTAAAAEGEQSDKEVAQVDMFEW